MQVAPKRESLAKAQDELSATMGQLANAQAKLKAVEEKMEVLQAQYVEAMGKKEGLAKQVCVGVRSCVIIYGWEDGSAASTVCGGDGQEGGAGKAGV